MKKRGIISLLIVLIVFFHLRFSNQNDLLTPARDGWKKNALQLNQKLKDLQALSLELEAPTKALKEDFKQTVLATRLHYKQYEFLYAYYYPQRVKATLNGAPLPHLDPFYPKAVVLPPNGLQRLDELAFSELSKAEIEEGQKLMTKLLGDFRPIYQNLKRHPMEQRELIEAMRMQVIRIFTLGVSGFDTPGSSNAIAEAEASFSGMLAGGAQLLQINEAGETCIGLMKSAKQYLGENNDFDRFDRLYFLKGFINPLYKQLLVFQNSAHIETIDEVFMLEKPLNYNSTNLFADDFLNPYYYSSLSPDMDNASIQELGEALFYSKKLSKNATMSCASCHHPEKGFADGLKTSVASNGIDSLARNAPTLINSVFSKRFFTDMRARRFDDQMEHVVTSSEEFNTSYMAIFKRLEADESLSSLFKQAFPKDAHPIHQTHFNQALNAYLISLRGFNSPFDQYVRGEKQHISNAIRSGFNLFMGKAACGSCHFAPTFSGLVPPEFDESESEVLGVLDKPVPNHTGIDSDRGRAVNGIPKEMDVYFYNKSFKTSTVRNVTLTAPYFHNGAYNSLEEVVAFYNHGGAAGLGLKLEHQTLPADSLGLSNTEQQQLIAFMEALTNSTYAQNTTLSY
jgi:cytochrome c peroxidase